MPRVLRWLLFGLVLVLPARAQVITTDPALPTVAEPVTILFDATGTPLENYQGTVYAHTGVNTAGANWQCVIGTWGNNGSQPALTRAAANRYRLHIEDVGAFYNVSGCAGVGSVNEITGLAFVFRSQAADGQPQTADLFVDLYEPGLNVTFTTPEASFLAPLIAERDTTVSVVAVASGAEWVRLLVNEAEVATTDADTLQYALDLSAPGRYDVVAIAEAGADADTAAFYAVRNAAVVEAPRPAGVEDGITYTSDTSVTLSLFAPYKDYVYVLGDFSDWEVRPEFLMRRHAVTPDSVHYWLTVDGLTPGEAYAFQYLIDGEIRIADPYTELVLSPDDGGIPPATYPDLKPYPAGQTDHAVSVLQPGQPAYDWQTESFERPAPHELVIYELLVRDFLAAHDYDTLIDSLDYLQRLGVNAIELMPVNEFEGNESWGYNTSFYFAPDKYYGPAEDLKRLVDAAHARGMAVILDVVLNHSYGQSPLVRMYVDGGRPTPESPYYNVEHNFQNPDAHWGYDFDHESTATQYFADRVLQHWLEAYRVDGFRFDFTKGIGNNPKPATGPDAWGSAYDADRIRLLKRMVDAMWAVEPGAYAIFEHLAENREEQELAEHGILLWANLNYNYNEATMGWHANGQSDFSWGFYERRGWEVPALVTYMESHDEERLMVKTLAFGNSSGAYDVQDLPVALDRMKLAGAFFFTLPGPKMIWQFGELGYDVSIDEPCRVCNKPIRWDYLDDPLRRKLYDTWSALLRLRSEHAVFTSPDTEVTLALAGETKRIVLQHPEMDAVIVGNFGVTTRTATSGFPEAGTWYDFFSGEPVVVSDPAAPLSLEPGMFHVFTSAPVFTPEAGLITVGTEAADGGVPDAYTLAPNYPNPFNPATAITYAVPTAGRVRLAVYDLLGREVAVLVDGLRQPGTHTATFDAGDLASGTYLYRLETPIGTLTRTMDLVK